MTMPASTPAYRKTIYEWSPEFGLPSATTKLTVVDLTSPEDPRLRGLVSRVLAASSDPADIALVRQHGQHAAAQFLNTAARDFAFQIGWWQLARDRNGEFVGFHLPAVFLNSTRRCLEEGTIYYIGVVPEHRRRFYGAALTRQSTRVFHQIGVWRAFCDTWEENRAMKAAFLRAGYREGKTRNLGVADSVG